MTKDEKAIWIAIFAVRLETITEGTAKCREDCVTLAIEETDHTILAMRRVASRSEKGQIHRIEPLIEEAEHGRGIDVSG